MIMTTEILSPISENLRRAADMLKNGQVIGMPTETVYGLAADACNKTAVENVFKAKARPSDNPLIVHISNMDMLEKIAYDIPKLAYTLAENLWPGALTMVLPKRDIIPDITSGGLDTVGVRMPSHNIARELINLSGCPVAAPSANRSGYPSPTTAMHVFNDMNGRIPAIVDGGQCSVGVESTVISFDDEYTVRILRPGLITPDDFMKYAKNVIVDSAILNETAPNQKVRSPGMKYKHYSPNSNVIMLTGSLDKFRQYVEKYKDENICCLIFDNDAGEFPFRFMTYGSTYKEMAYNLFAKLREADELGIETVFVRTPSIEGVGLAVYNRLIRAAGFEVIEL